MNLTPTQAMTQAVQVAIDEATAELHVLLVKHTELERKIQAARERIAVQKKHMKQVRAYAGGV